MAKFIGTGAAGNKSVINAIENNIISIEDALLINTTLIDIPQEYHNISIKIGGIRGGCGKERNVAKELTIESLKDNTLEKLDHFFDPIDETVFIISSTEGGSGSGSVPIIAEYIKNVHNLNIHIIGFTGFEDDARGLRNTVEFFEDLSEDYIVEIISNKKFLEEANDNRLKAQELANTELYNRLSVILGQDLVKSDNNIDETDLYKVTNTPGYLSVEMISLGRNLKNVEQFNKIVSQTLDNTKSIDIINPGVKRIAIILNIKEETKNKIDYSFDIIKDRYGYPFELFLHVQSENDIEFINLILSGMKLPITEVKEIDKKYHETLSMINTNKDDFFDVMSSREKDNIDMFNSAKRNDIVNTNYRREKYLKSLNDKKSNIDNKEDLVNKY